MLSSMDNSTGSAIFILRASCEFQFGSAASAEFQSFDRSANSGGAWAGSRISFRISSSLVP